MQKIRGAEPVGVIIHIHMEISQANSLGSYLYLKQAKISFFSVFFFLLQNQRIGGQNRPCGAGGGGLVPVGGGRW
jgi:hypothetical protein